MNSPEKVRGLLAVMAGLGAPGMFVGHGGVLRLPVEAHPRDRDYGPRGEEGVEEEWWAEV